MGLFRDQASRLLRESWPDARLLAEELFAIFTADVPIKIDSPVEITNTTRGPGLTIRNFGPGDGGAVQIQRFYPPPPDLPGIPPLDDGGRAGDTSTTVIYEDGGLESFDGLRDSPQRGSGTTVNVSGGGGGFPGVVVSGGPGNDYLVDVYLGGLSGPPTELPVRQLSIAADATIPPGTWAVVGSQRVGEEVSYFMQVPVWAEDL